MKPACNSERQDSSFRYKILNISKEGFHCVMLIFKNQSYAEYFFGLDEGDNAGSGSRGAAPGLWVGNRGCSH